MTTDMKVRNEKYLQLQKIIEEEVPAIFLQQITLNYSVSKKIKGMDLGFVMSPADRFQNITKWYIKSKR